MFHFYIFYQIIHSLTEKKILYFDKVISGSVVLSDCYYLLKCQLCARCWVRQFIYFMSFELRKSFLSWWNPYSQREMQKSSHGHRNSKWQAGVESRPFWLQNTISVLWLSCDCSVNFILIFKNIHLCIFVFVCARVYHLCAGAFRG